MMFKKIASLVLALLITLCVISACDDIDDVSSSGDTSFDLSSEASDNDASDIQIIIGDVSLTVDSVNADSGDVRIFDRNYKKDTYELSIKVGDGRVCIVTKLNSAGNVSVTKITKWATDSVTIPLNGYVVSVPADLYNENINAKIGTAVTTSGYTPPDYEILEFAYVTNDSKTVTRRINMLYPSDGKLEEGKLYLCSEDDSYTVPDNSVALVLTKAFSNFYTINSVAESGALISNTVSLLFCGEYNSVFCRNYFELNTKLTISNQSLLNNITDLQSVTVNDLVYPLDENHLNTTSPDEGISVYNSDYGRTVTPAVSSDFICVVVSSGKVVYKSKLCERVIIPSNGDYVMLCTGDSVNDAEKLAIGTSVKSVIAEPSRKPKTYVFVAGNAIEYNGRNIALESKKAVLYSSIYGDSTKTANGTLEIVFKDGIVTDVNTHGDSVIPDGGYVMSIDAGSNAYQTALDIAKGFEISISSGTYEYSTTVLNYTRINGTRYTDELIIYDGTEASTTKTNIYGYEIIVDANGIACGGSTDGNSVIPEGGFVVSGHGVNSEALSSIYKCGMFVSYDKSDKTVTFVTSPALNIVEAATVLSDAKLLLDEAKSQFYAINYSYVEERLSCAERLYSEAEAEYEKGNTDSAILLSVDVQDALSGISYCMYESLAVENRSTWYRSSEKSDDEVRATVEKMAELGINAIYIETWYNGYTIGYSSDERIKHLSSVHGEYDVLEGFCRIAHEYGIEVHAWCENFFIGTPSGYLAELMKDKRCIDRNGKDRYPNSYGDFIFLNPNDRECRDLVLGIYKELVEKYDLDGIHLDYIRFSEPNPDNGDFGYNSDIIAGFQEKYSTDVDPHDITSSHPLWTKWCKYREDIINTFVEEVYESLKAIEPDIYISAACYPDIYNVPTWNYQNFREWVNNGYIDEIFSMSYGSSVSYPVSNAKDFLSAIKEKCFYSIGVCAFDCVEAQVLAEQIFFALKAGASGSSPFSWGSLVNHSLNYFDALKSGVYSKSATRLDKGSATVVAGMNDLIYNIENAYSYLAPEYTEYYDSLVAKASLVIKNADSFDYLNASTDEKLQYCNEALTAMNELVEIADCDNKQLSAAVKRCINVTINAMEISITRLKANQ